MRARIADAVARSSLIRYLITGVFISGIDAVGFGIFSLGFGWNVVVANIASTMIAMTISYYINRSFVFQSSTRSASTQIMFFGVTAFTGFVLQSVVIYLIVAAGLTIAGPDLREIVIPTAKIIAMGVGATANFLLYRLVFKSHGSTTG